MPAESAGACAQQACALGSSPDLRMPAARSIAAPAGAAARRVSAGFGTPAGRRRRVALTLLSAVAAVTSAPLLCVPSTMVICSHQAGGGASGRTRAPGRSSHHHVTKKQRNDVPAGRGGKWPSAGSHAAPAQQLRATSQHGRPRPHTELLRVQQQQQQPCSRCWSAIHRGTSPPGGPCCGAFISQPAAASGWPCAAARWQQASGAHASNAVNQHAPVRCARRSASRCYAWQTSI